MKKREPTSNPRLKEFNVMSTLRLSLLFLTAVLIGCSGREAPERIVDPPGPRIMKAALEEIQRRLSERKESFERTRF